MRYLMDTQVLLWMLFHTKRLPEQVAELLKDPAKEILVSAVSFWEISLKYRLGKIEFDRFDPASFPEICANLGFPILPFQADDAASYHLLHADYHKDPFDRMLIWQAFRNNLIFLSGDARAQQYQSEGLRVFWA